MTYQAVSRQSVRPLAQGAADALSQHWLAAANVLLLAFGGLPWLAPLFMKLGAELPARVVYFSYRFLCHQLASRSFFLFGPKVMYSTAELQTTTLQSASGLLAFHRFVGSPDMGFKVAWSDRMVAMWAGVLLGGLVYGVLRERMRPMGLRTFLWFLVPIALDGTSHMVSDLAGVDSGFRQSNAWLSALTGQALSDGFYSGNLLGSFNSWMRLGSGLLFGLAVAWFVYPRIGDGPVPWKADASPRVSGGDEQGRSERKVTDAMQLHTRAIVSRLLRGCLLFQDRKGCRFFA